jgi:hypothetical protein
MSPAYLPAHAARLPGLLWHDGGTRRDFLVRPRSVYDTGDGSGVIGVLHRDGAQRESGPGRGSLRWTRWNERSARAVGTYWLKLGTPTATSPFTREPLIAYAYRVRGGHFTRFKLLYRQDGRRVHTVLCLSEYDRTYTWGSLYRGRCM